MLIKQVLQKNVSFAIIGTLKMLDSNLNHMFVINFGHDLSVTAYELKNIAIFNVKGVDFRFILWGISRDEAVNKLNNSVLGNKGAFGGTYFRNINSGVTGKWYKKIMERIWSVERY